jgi:hypothetical protein
MSATAAPPGELVPEACWNEPSAYTSVRSGREQNLQKRRMPAPIRAYHKQINSHEFDTFEQNGYEVRPGAHSGTFDVSELSVGVEICADLTSAGSLRSTLIERGKPTYQANCAANPFSRSVHPDSMRNCRACRMHNKPRVEQALITDLEPLLWRE